MKKNCTENGLEISLHRIILSKTYLNSERVNEINIQAIDIADISSLKGIINQAEIIKVITVKIFGLTKDSKVVTTRIDRNGSLMIYGNHKNETILDLLKYITISM